MAATEHGPERGESLRRIARQTSARDEVTMERVTTISTTASEGVIGRSSSSSSGPSGRVMRLARVLRPRRDSDCGCGVILNPAS